MLLYLAIEGILIFWIIYSHMGHTHFLQQNGPPMGKS